VSEHTVNLSDADFKTEVLESETPVLVDFWAEWCGPCKMIGPVVDEIAREHAGSLKVGKLDIDSNQQTAMDHGVFSIPTLILFKGGKEAERIVGNQPKAQLLSVLKPHLASTASA